MQLQETNPVKQSYFDGDRSEDSVDRMKRRKQSQDGPTAFWHSKVTNLLLLALEAGCKARCNSETVVGDRRN